MPAITRFFGHDLVIGKRRFTPSYNQQSAEKSMSKSIYYIMLQFYDSYIIVITTNPKTSGLVD